MITSAPLIIVLLLLTVGLVVTVIAAWRKARFAPEITIAFVTVSLLLWLLLGTNLPHSLTLVKWSAGGVEVSWSLLVDTLTWRSSLYLLLLSTAALLIARPQLKPGAQDLEISPTQWLLLPILLLLVLTGLLAIWADSLAGLASSWTILAISWFAFIWIAGRPITQVRRNLTYGGTLLLGVGFLWLAEATLPSSLSGISDAENWSEPAIIWTSLAAMVYLGAIPFQWWRSIDQWNKLSTSATALIYLVPGIVGGSLLARIASFDATNTGYLLFVTGFGLIGYLVGISLAWIHLGKPRKSLSGLILAEAGMVMLVGVWATPTAAVAQVGVFTLAMAAFYLVSEKPQWRFNWPIILPVGALAGMPMTIGFLGLTDLYSSWLDRDLLTLMLVAVFLNIPLIAVSILAWRSEELLTRREPFDRFQPILDAGGLALLSLGLFALPDFSLASNDFLILLSLGLAGVGGITLAWFVGRTSLAQTELKDAFRLNLPRNQVRKLFEQLVASITLVVREAVTILEGEGGMLWVVVLIIVMWLARRG